MQQILGLGAPSPHWGACFSFRDRVKLVTSPRVLGFNDSYCPRCMARFRLRGCFGGRGDPVLSSPGVRFVCNNSSGSLARSRSSGVTAQPRMALPDGQREAALRPLERILMPKAERVAAASPGKTIASSKVRFAAWTHAGFTTVPPPLWRTPPSRHLEQPQFQLLPRRRAFHLATCCDH